MPRTRLLLGIMSLLILLVLLGTLNQYWLSSSVSPNGLLRTGAGGVSSTTRQPARGGHYAELYNTYFRHQSLEYVEGLQSLMTSDR